MKLFEQKLSKNFIRQTVTIGEHKAESTDKILASWEDVTITPKRKPQY